jgi:hypothetical protein
METTVKIKNPAIRCYSKTDLAMLYFPEAKPHTALWPPQSVDQEVYGAG